MSSLVEDNPDSQAAKTSRVEEIREFLSKFFKENEVCKFIDLCSESFEDEIVTLSSLNEIVADSSDKAEVKLKLRELFADDRFCKGGVESPDVPGAIEERAALRKSRRGKSRRSKSRRSKSRR